MGPTQGDSPEPAHRQLLRVIDPRPGLPGILQRFQGVMLEVWMSSDRFCYYLRVRYGECDAQKVVFNARYADYVDLATAEWLRALGFEHEIQTGEFDYQLVRQTLEWKSPARYDQVLEVAVAVKQIGNTSFTLGAEFRIAGDERVIATAETVYVHVDTKTLQKQPVPQRLREAFTRGAPGVSVDHAGHLR